MRKYRYKGRFVTEKQFKKFMKIKRTGEKNRERKVICEKLQDFPIIGHRILDIKLIAEQMVCKCCGQDLSIRNIESEKLYGLSSVWTVRCQHCLDLVKIHTGGRHKNRKGFWVYDANSLSGLGE